MTMKHSLPYCASVELTWLDHENNYKPKSTVRIFRGKDQADLDLIITDYVIHNGIIKTQILSQEEIQ